MRSMVQRVDQASVEVEGSVIAAIGPGLLTLVGVAPDDGPGDSDALADKIAHLRLFADAEGRMERSVIDAGGSVLVVSQFTLYGDVRRGRRPSWSGAAPPEIAEPLIERVVGSLRRYGLDVATGSFGATMKVESVNDGPVSILVETSAGRVV